MKHYSVRTSKSGYIMLMSVLIVAAVALSIALSILLTGIDNNSLSGIFQSGKISQHVADACMEQALQKLKNNSSYAGNETYTFPRGETCTIQTISGSGTANRTIKVQSNAGSMIRKIQVQVNNSSPSVILDSWLEVSDHY